MNSEDLGLPIEYRQYPEYFDIPANTRYTNEKNKVIESMLRKHKIEFVLDMACGTGAQVFYLTKLGYHVIGADFSPGLLKIAREKALKNNFSVEFIEGDMRTLQAGQFDAVITIDNAIGHLVKDDFNLTIRNIYDNLKPGGIYIFDILNLDAMTDDVIKADSEKMSDINITKDGVKISNARQSSIDRTNGILTAHETITIAKNNTQEKINNTCSLQIYTMNALKDMLTEHKFKVITQQKIDAYTFCQDDKGYSILTVAQKL